MPTVDRVNGTPAARAARAAWTSPRRAIIPARPIGASTSGSAQASPSRLAAVSTPATSTSTRWRSCQARPVGAVGGQRLFGAGAAVDVVGQEPRQAATGEAR